MTCSDAIPTSVLTAVRTAIAAERAKPIPFEPGCIMLSAGQIYDVLQQIAPGLCSDRSSKYLKKLITIAVQVEGGEVRTRARCSGFSTYLIPDGVRV